MKTLILGDNLAEKLAKHLDLEAVLVKEKKFPDGELQPQLAKEPRADQIILILQKKVQESINDYLIKFFILAKKIKESASKTIGIMPYLPYARQDAVFEEGEALSSLYLAEMIGRNLDVFITCNAHEHRKKIKDLFTIPAHNLFLFKDLADSFKDFDPAKTIVIAPDREAKTFADDFCQDFPAAKLVFLKQRNTKTGQISFSYPEQTLQNKEIILIDDIVATGGTILEAAKISQKLGAQTISFAFVHAIFGDQSIESLREINPKRIIAANTIENTQYQLEITESLAKFIRQTLQL